MTTKLLGERTKRKEDPRLIQGRGHFVDDLKLDGMLHLTFVRSVHAHARLKKVDTTAAKSMRPSRSLCPAVAQKN